MSYDDDKQELEDMKEKLSDKEIQKDVKTIKSMDPLTSLKLNLFSFFESRLRVIEEEDTFESRIKEAILEKVETGELSTSQLMQLYTNVKNQGSKSLEVLLDVFKPSQSGNVSPLVEEQKVNNGNQVSASTNEFKELNPDEKDTLHKFAKMMTEANPDKEKDNQ